MTSSTPSSDIQNVNGDIIGMGVSGSGNVIGKDINLVINRAQSFGLNLLPPNYFNEYISSEQDLNDWRNGFSFKLESIMERKELRRKTVDKIKNILEKERKLLITGESGTSKSTILMEIMCEYFSQQYRILYNFGETEIRDSLDLVRFIEDLLKGGNNVLVAIDNVHSERTAAIFHVIDRMSNFDLKKNLCFILTARLPEFDWFVNDRLNAVEEVYRQSIRKFVQYPSHRYELENFTEKEIEEFIEKYTAQETKTPNGLICDLSLKIFNETKGHPIMVKFYVLGKGLDEDVKDRYYRYLFDTSSSSSLQPDLAKIKTVLICSLLDIANLPITDKMLESMGVLKSAFDLEHALLYQSSDGLWKTIHTKWAMALLYFLYSEKNKGILSKRKEYLKNTLNSIFSISDESTSSFIIQTVYDMVPLKVIPIGIIESTTNIPPYLSNKAKSNLYLFAIGTTYRKLQMYPQMMDSFNKSLELEPSDTNVLNANAISFGLVKRYDEALMCCDKAVKINPNDAAAWTTKGLVLNELKRYDEALQCWRKAVDIDDSYVGGIWSKKQHYLPNTKDYDYSTLNRLLALKLISRATSCCFLKKYGEALECSNKAMDLDSGNVLDNMNNKAWALNGLKRYEKALECSNKAMELDPKNMWTCTHKSWALNGLKRYEKALECSNKAMEGGTAINDFSTWNNKAVSLNGLKRYEEALECSNKAMELNSAVDWTWFVKGVILNGLGRYEEALECSNKAIKLDPNNDITWNNKAWALCCLKRYDEALECSNKAMGLDPNNAWAWENKSRILNMLQRYDEALECSNKAIKLDPNNIPPAFIS